MTRILVLILTATLSMLPLVLASGSADATSKPTCLKVDPKFADNVLLNNYAASVRTRIARRIVAVDCAGLQAEFDIALENNVAQRRRDPKGNIPLMDYLDKSMRAIG